MPDNRHQDRLRQRFSYRAPYHQIEDDEKRRKSYISKVGVPIDHVCKYTKNPPMILIDAVYVHHSGVRILLDSLIRSLESANSEVAYLLDSRIHGVYDHLGKDKVHYIPGSAIDRYRFYRENQHRFRRVVCFSSVPPPIRIDGECVLYLQSTLMFTMDGVTRTTFLKRLAHNIYMRLTRRFVDRWIVQTEHMRTRSRRFLGNRDIDILPFFPEADRQERIRDDHFHFLYASDGYPHKNHLRLFEAFERVAQLRPDATLHVTISNAFPELKSQISELQRRGVPVLDHGFVPHSEVFRLYAIANAQVYPSLTEALGIGLIESAQMDLPVLAADLPYVHELIKTPYRFNPFEVGTMANAMMAVRDESNLHPAELKIQNRLDELTRILLA